MEHSRTSRRQFLAASARLAAGAGIASIVAIPPAGATPETLRGAIAEIVGDAQLREGRVTLGLPPLVENGNAVPLTVSVDSEMSEKSYVKALYIAADGNPSPGVAIYQFTPMSGKAEVQMRVKLAQTQKLIAVAEMNDGTLYTASREVKVTIGGCGG